MKIDGSHSIHATDKVYGNGLSKREEFAKSFLSGLLAGGIKDVDHAVDLAVTVADKFIERLNK